MANREKPAGEESPAIKTFQVTLNCPTPLRENPALVEASSEESAWEEFKRVNRISGSDHPRQVVAV